MTGINQTDEFFCYSQRIMNPFRGTLNIVRYRAAEAVTIDGIEWDIYVNDDELLKGIDESANTRCLDGKSRASRSCLAKRQAQPQRTR